MKGVTTVTGSDVKPSWLYQAFSFVATDFTKTPGFTFCHRNDKPMFRITADPSMAQTIVVEPCNEEETMCIIRVEGGKEHIEPIQCADAELCEKLSEIAECCSFKE